MKLKSLREEVLEANLELVRRGLVLYTFGNASGISREDGLVVIKPSGVPYESMKLEDLVVVDLDGKSQRDLLGNSGTAPVGITPFHFNDGVNEFFVRSLRAGPPTALGRKQHAVLSFHQHVVEMQQSCRPQNDGRTKKAGRAHEKGAQTGDNAIGRTQVGRTLASAIEDQELMFDEEGLGTYGTDAARPRQSGDGCQEMDEKDYEIAHLRIVARN